MPLSGLVIGQSTSRSVLPADRGTIVIGLLRGLSKPIREKRVIAQAPSEVVPKHGYYYCFLAPGMFIFCLSVHIHSLFSHLSSRAEIPSLGNSYQGKSGTFGFTADTRLPRHVIKEG